MQVANSWSNFLFNMNQSFANETQIDRFRLSFQYIIGKKPAKLFELTVFSLIVPLSLIIPPDFFAFKTYWGLSNSPVLWVWHPRVWHRPQRILIIPQLQKNLCIAEFWMFLILLLCRTHFRVLLYRICTGGLVCSWKVVTMPNQNLRVKHKKNTIKFKEEVVRYAKEHSVNQTAEKFAIHLKICIVEYPASFFQFQSNDVKYFHALEKISPLFLTIFKNFLPPI